MLVDDAVAVVLANSESPPNQEQPVNKETGEEVSQKVSYNFLFLNIFS
jgi:hypothetical protein